MNFFKTLCICLPFTLLSCKRSDSVSDEDAKAKAEQQRLADEAKIKTKEANKKKVEMERLAAEEKKKLESEAREAEIQKLKLAEDKRLEEDRIEKERLEQEAIITALRIKQKAARELYVGTKYESLTVEGKEYKSLVVTKANDSHVSFMHSTGVANIKYTDLSEDIRKACVYDERTILEEKPQVTRRPVAKVEKKKKAGKKASSAAAKKAPTKAPEPKKKAPNHGGIKTRVVRMYQKYFPEYNRKFHVKDLSVAVRANTEAKLYFNGSMVMNIPANKTMTFNGTSLPKGKYKLELKDTKGKTLDTETDGRKSGL